MILVKNSHMYWEFIRKLRNLDGVKEGFIQQGHITRQMQQEYMSKYSECFYICLRKQQKHTVTNLKFQNSEISKFQKIVCFCF